MRAMALHYPNDPVAVGKQYQYLLGDAILAAPVTEPNATEAAVYLPAGRWYHPWNGGTTYDSPPAARRSTCRPPTDILPSFSGPTVKYSELKEAFDALA